MILKIQRDESKKNKGKEQEQPKEMNVEDYLKKLSEKGDVQKL